jgi:hypothetical protein
MDQTQRIADTAAKQKRGAKVGSCVDRAAWYGRAS